MENVELRMGNRISGEARLLTTRRAVCPFHIQHSPFNIHNYCLSSQPVSVIPMYGVAVLDVSDLSPSRLGRDGQLLSQRIEMGEPAAGGRVPVAGGGRDDRADCPLHPVVLVLRLAEIDVDTVFADE